MEIKQIAIIGKGRFGIFVHKKLSAILDKDTKFKFYERSDSLSDLTEADLIIPCLPIFKLENFYREISKLELNTKTILIDIASVKVMPARALKEHLADKIEVIASHPLFGPDSAQNGLQGLKMMIYNLSASQENYSQIKVFLTNLGLEVLEMTPDEHDKYMAFSQSYTHLLGRIGAEMGIQSTPIDTKGFEQTLKIQNYVVNDDIQLFLDMFDFNPYTKKMLESFETAFGLVKEKIK